MKNVVNRALVAKNPLAATSEVLGAVLLGRICGGGLILQRIL